jgi:hypothetical protein
MEYFLRLRERESAPWAIYPLGSAPFLSRYLEPFLPHWACPQCGIEWASVFPAEIKPDQRHVFSHKPCSTCGVGSLRLWGNFPYSNLSEELLLREINLIFLHGEQYEYSR